MKITKNIAYGDFKEQLLDLYIPDGEYSNVFVYFHGGGLESGDKSEDMMFSEYLANNGIAVVNANYRMYPAYVYPEFIRDAASAVAWAKKNFEGKKIYVGGSSAGSYISMMLCFDKKYLAPHKINPSELAGFVHNAGQPTTHFNVLRERGLERPRVIIDEAAPIYHIGTDKTYPPMLFIVSDNDMQNRLEQINLVMSTLKHFGFEGEKYKMLLLPGKHCDCVYSVDENGDSTFGKIIYNFIKEA